MTNHDELAAALDALRGEVRDLVPVPDAAGLRGRATHQLRVRRTATAALAAVAVIAVAIGGNTLFRPTAAPPEPVEPIPTVSPSLPPTQPPPVTPSPRPVPVTPATVDDPIVDTDWRLATITIPARNGCPEGPVTFVPTSGTSPTSLGPVDQFPKLILDATNAAYGDLTGDGNAEAVVQVRCAESEEAIGSGHGTQLLVVTRQDDGALMGLGWAGPPDAGYLSYWTADGRLLIDADPSTTNAEDHFPHVPGLALAYEWSGSGFTGWDPAAEYPPIVPLDPQDTGAPVQLRAAVASGLGCPDVELRLSRTGEGWTGSEGAAGTTYTVPASPFQPFLLDLDGTGDRLLVTPLVCTRADGTDRQGLVVLERAGDGWQGVSVLVYPAGQEPVRWWWEEDRFRVEWSGTDATEEIAYRWTGTVFIAVNE